MAIEVILHRVLLRRDPQEDTPAAQTKREMERLGFTAPQSVLDEIEKQALREKASMDKGTIVALGSTAFKDYGFDHPPIKVGDHVAFARFGGKEIVDPETKETLLVLNDEDVVAILTEKEPA